MAGFRLGPKLPRLRRNPPQRRRWIQPGTIVVVPAQISGSSSASATASLSLTAPSVFAASSLTSNAAASGTLGLSTTSSSGVRAAPGWLGLFITDSSGSSIPLIAGGSSGVASAALALLTPSRAQLSGSSNSVAAGTLVLIATAPGQAQFIFPTALQSALFGSTALQSGNFGTRGILHIEPSPVS